MGSDIGWSDSPLEMDTQEPCNWGGNRVLKVKVIYSVALRERVGGGGSGKARVPGGASVASGEGLGLNAGN